MHNNNKLIVRNTLFLYIRSIVILIISLYTTRVFLRVLGVEDYGVQNVVGGFVTMFGFLNVSMSKAIQRFYNFAAGIEDSQKLSCIYTNSLLIQTLLAILIALFTEIVGIWALNNYLVIPLGREEAAFWVFQFSTLSMVIGIMMAPYSAAIIAHEKMNVYAYVSILDAVLKLGFAIVLPFIPCDKLVVYGSLGLFTYLIEFGIYFLYSKKKFSELVFIRNGVSKSVFISILSFSGWNILAAFSNIMKSQGINVLLNRFFGSAINAARGISFQILTALRMLVDNIQIAVKPQLVKSYASGDVKRTFELMFFTSKIAFLLMYMLSLPIVLEIQLILHLWLGDGVPEYTSVFTIVIILVSLVDCLNAPVSFVIQAANKMKFYHLTYSIILLLIVPVSYIVLRMGGDPVSVFWVSLFVGIINQVACLYVLKMEVPFSVRAYMKKVAIPCIMTLFISPVIPLFLRLTLQESILRMIIVGVVSVAVSAFIILIVACDAKERTFIISFLKK